MKTMPAANQVNILRFLVVVAVFAAAHGNDSFAKTPPMGWMSWQTFRCQVDCESHPDGCVSEKLYREIADQLEKDNYHAYGYNHLMIDDCWMAWTRDPESGELMANATRFPSGMASMGEYVHSKNLRFGIYEDEGSKTCQNYPGSEGHETLDANLFAKWQVDYLKLDGCNNNIQGYTTGYPKFGDALAKSGRNITYSCSWPAYLGDDESKKPFGDFVKAGCNLWRNWADVQCMWSSVKGIIEHWGEYSQVLAKAAGPGHWNDPDMLLAGTDCLTLTEETTQMAIWSIVAAPLIMGNDVRNMTKGSLELLQNKDIIAVDQDILGKAGVRITEKGVTSQVWTRELNGGDMGVVLYNSADGDDGVSIALDLQQIGFGEQIAHVRDLVNNKDLGIVQVRKNFTVLPHGVQMFRLSEA